jgi:NADP-dependent 3-hydroxy acid dehydrogenase YdfG
LSDPVFVVTGATSGIGLAIASCLADTGRVVYALGRRKDVPPAGGQPAGSDLIRWKLDLEDDASILAFASHLEDKAIAVAGLIHCAGTHVPGALETSDVSQLDSMYQVNTRAPYLLTQSLLPHLSTVPGQVIFINSSAGLGARSGVGAYSATKHALRALADAWRQELGPRGIRITSIYPGRTATPLMEAQYAHDGKQYDPSRLLQPNDIARIVVSILSLPQRVEVTDISIRSSYGGY